MIQYQLPRPAVIALEEGLQSKERAHVLVGAFEGLIGEVEQKAGRMTVVKIEQMSVQLKDDLCSLLVTKEVFEKRCDTLVTKEVFEKRCDTLVTKEAFEKRCDTLVTKEAFEKRCNTLVTKEDFENRCNTFVTKDIFSSFRNEMNARFETVNERIRSLDTKFTIKFDSLRNEIGDRFYAVDICFKSLNFRLTILIILTLAALTLANPAFVALFRK